MDRDVKILTGPFCMSGGSSSSGVCGVETSSRHRPIRELPATIELTPASIESTAPASIELTFHRCSRDGNVSVSADGLTASVMMNAAIRQTHCNVTHQGPAPGSAQPVETTAGAAAGTETRMARARTDSVTVTGVVTSCRPLLDDELFEFRIDRLIDTCSASLQAGKSVNE